MTFEIISLNISTQKGEKKRPVPEVEFITDSGIKGDAHAGNGHRQVSLLAMESIVKMQDKGLAVRAGDFAENVTTQGIVLPSLPIGTRLKLGGQIILEVTQIGKECHTRCAIYQQAGDCVMPKEGIFAKVIFGGTLRTGEQGAMDVS